MQYLLLIYGDEAHWAGLSKEESDAIFDEYRTFTEAIAAQGIMQGGAALTPVSTARTVRVREGRSTVSDGPFAETREQLGGYYLLDVKDLDEAIEWAGKCPGAQTGKIELRPIMEFDQG